MQAENQAREIRYSMCKGPEAGRIGIHLKDQKKTHVAGAQARKSVEGSEVGDPDSNQVP